MAQSTSEPISLKAPEHLAEITMDNTNNSPLLRLPGELRNKIYEHVFDGHFCTSTRNDLAHMPTDLVAITGDDLRCRLCIPSTCRQLYAETAKFALTSTVFEFAMPYALTSCIKVLPPYVKEAIREIGFYGRYGRGRIAANARRMIEHRVGEAVEDSAGLPNLKRIHLWTSMDARHDENAAYLKTLEAGVKRPDGRVIEIIVRFSEYMDKRPWGSSGEVGELYCDQYALIGAQSDRRH